MKIYHTIIILLFCRLGFAGDTLQFNKYFPKIETVVLQDTLIDISKGPLDTFAIKPKFIFIVRNYDDLVSTGNIRKIYIQDINLPEIGYFEYVYGINSSVDIFSRLDIYKQGHEYSVKIIYSYGYRHDTVKLKTHIIPDVGGIKSYVYEVRLGLDACFANCTITSRKKLHLEQKNKIRTFLNSKPVDYFGGNERWYLYIKQDIVQLLKVDEKFGNGIYCNCKSALD